MLADHLLDRIETVKAQARFFQELYGPTLDARHRLVLGTLKPEVRFVTAAGIEEAEHLLGAFDPDDRLDFYFGTCLIGRDLAAGERHSRRDVTALAALWADLDCAAPYRPGKALPPRLEDAVDLVHEIPCPPTVTISSGAGLHGYWVLDAPLLLATDEDRARAEAVSKGWHRLLGGLARDRGWVLENTADLARILRIPGTSNWKDPSQPKAVAILEADYERRYSIAEFEPYALPVSEAGSQGGDVGEDLVVDAGRPLPPRVAALLETSSTFRRTWAHERDGELPDSSLSGYDMSLALQVALHEGSDQEIADTLIAHRRHQGRPEKALRRGYLQPTIARARAQAEALRRQNAEAVAWAQQQPFLQKMMAEWEAKRQAPVAPPKEDSKAQAQALPVVPTVTKPVAVPEWGDPLPLEDHLLTEWPDDLLPGWLGTEVNALADALEVPREMPALLGLATVATAVQGTFTVRPEPGYFEQLSLWAAPAMASGDRKSAVLTRLTRPLVDWETKRNHAMAEERQRNESRRRILEARLNRMRSQYAKAEETVERAQIEAEILKVEKSIPPSMPELRLITGDVTPERLGAMLAEQDEHIGIFSTEAGIFSIMAGLYSSGMPNLDVFLQGHCGDFVRVDRGSREPVVLHRPKVTFGVSPQVEALRDLGKQRALRGRGLLARFLYAIPKSKVGQRQLLCRPVPEDASNAYAAGLQALLQLGPRRDPDHQRNLLHVLLFDPPAYEVWKSFQREVEPQLAEGGRLEAIRDWGSKLPGAVARIAGVLHCVVHAQDDGGPRDYPVTKDIMGKAVSIGRLLSEHALAAFDVIGADRNLEWAREIWRRVCEAQAVEITYRDLWHPLRRTIKHAAEAEAAIQALIDRGYLVPTFDSQVRQRGRPSRRFLVNPKALALGA